MDTIRFSILVAALLSALAVSGSRPSVSTSSRLGNIDLGTLEGGSTESGGYQPFVCVICQ